MTPTAIAVGHLVTPLHRRLEEAKKTSKRATIADLKNEIRRAQGPEKRMRCNHKNLLSLYYPIEVVKVNKPTTTTHYHHHHPPQSRSRYPRRKKKAKLSFVSPTTYRQTVALIALTPKTPKKVEATSTMMVTGANTPRDKSNNKSLESENSRRWRKSYILKQKPPS